MALRAVTTMRRRPGRSKAVALPEYPDKNHLINVPIEIAGSSLDMFIDERSLSVGADGVVRYVLVLSAQSGAENVFFEGIRCATRELRSYAYGTSRSAWQSVDTAWAPLSGLGVGRYREQLYQYYLCHAEEGDTAAPGNAATHALWCAAR